MAPVIRISTETFSMLQKVAQPLVDTPDSAIRKALVAYLEMQSSDSTTGTSRNSVPTLPHAHGVMTFDPDTPPDLTHASFKTGFVADRPVDKWNRLLIEAHAKAFESVGKDIAALQRISEANIRQEETTEAGFKPVNDFGFSVQGVESNKAWSISRGLAKKFGFPISIEFRWQQKEGAAFPGQAGRIHYEP